MFIFFWTTNRHENRVRERQRRRKKDKKKSSEPYISFILHIVFYVYVHNSIFYLLYTNSIIQNICRYNEPFHKHTRIQQNHFIFYRLSNQNQISFIFVWWLSLFFSSKNVFGVILWPKILPRICICIDC